MKLTGEKARDLLEAQLAEHSEGVDAALSRYCPRVAVNTLHRAIRSVEEFINIPMFEIPYHEDVLRLTAIRLDNAFISDPLPAVKLAKSILDPLFDPQVVSRYLQTMLQTAAISQTFRIHGQNKLGKQISLDTIGGAIDYYQSRRRHLVILLYSMPRSCTGIEVLENLDALNVLLPVIEQSCISITGFHQKLALLDIYDDFHLTTDARGFLASHDYNTLDKGFMEPERASIQVMLEMRREIIGSRKLRPLKQKVVFSAEELRNSVKLIQAAYQEFDVNDGDFAALSLLIVAFSRHCSDDYFVEISKQKFLAILRAQSTFDPDELYSMLVNSPGDYTANSNAYEPFIESGATVVSNVNLLSRYLYAFKNIHLGSRKRFQIHCGFIFEDVVKKDLEELGFNVTDIKRINRKEFDVVTTYQGAIHNFQCKNNWVDLANVESDRKLFVRYNRSMVNYYRKALVKEQERENLLKSKLELSEIHHYVISRFPVICDIPSIINHNEIRKLPSLISQIGSS